ncbi:hypothetical protein MTR67_002272 [Solanum verrucosum]|uniref:Uncharacterized protein n=1 Tax=Solanum verrucosum TaxID=315347 RepID=A0AAF0T5R6_SOLVR|nr:hypothetical protein MTR67_002272 [Solanum verrucosum]
MSSFRGRSLLNLNSNHALRGLKKSHVTDSEVTDPSMEVQTECSPLEPPCAESEANSHASTEVPLDPELTTAVKVIKISILQIPLHPELRTAAKVIKILILPIPLEE